MMAVWQRLDLETPGHSIATRGNLRAACLVALVTLLAIPAFSDSGATATQSTFASPEKATDALISAVRSGRTDTLLRILGPSSKRLISSGDTVADAEARKKLISEFDNKNEVEAEGDDRAFLVVGDDGWQFPYPIVKYGSAWRFDASAGATEILDRRIGANELDAIEVCRAYVSAQREYAEKDRNNDGYVEYAQKFLSNPGRQDGLYWPTGVGEEESPLGPLVVSARAEGYSPSKGKERTPYHGYYYKILTGQGPSARDGAYDYIVNGHMIGGFALVAFPAQYGASGIMTFIVNHDGVVYQKNLGRRTSELAINMKLFDPDSSWSETP